MERMPFVGGDGHQAISTLDFPENYFKWAFIRNPLDRLVSFHHAVWQHPNNILRAKLPERFDELVERLDEFKNIIHLRPQVLFLTGVEMDFIGRYETITMDWMTVCETIGVRYCRLPRLNATKRDHWSRYYRRCTTLKVTEFYEDDLQFIERLE